MRTAIVASAVALLVTVPLGVADSVTVQAHVEVRGPIRITLDAYATAWLDQSVVPDLTELPFEDPGTPELLPGALPILVPDLTGASTSTPEWPLTGTFALHERGFYEEGARCPVVDAGPLAPVAPALEGALPGDDPRLGNLTTDVSEYAMNSRGYVLQSNVQYWEIGLDPAVDPPTASYWYTNWTLSGTPLTDYWCREPSASRGLVAHESIITGRLDRIDPA